MTEWEYIPCYLGVKSIWQDVT